MNQKPESNNPIKTMIYLFNLFDEILNNKFKGIMHFYRSVCKIYIIFSILNNLPSGDSTIVPAEPQRFSYCI